MMPYALALLAACVAALGFVTFAQARRTVSLALQCSTLAMRSVSSERRQSELVIALKQMRDELKLMGSVVVRSAPMELAARVDDLTAAVDADRLARRKELGKIWGRLTQTLPGFAGDPELQAFLKLQGNGEIPK